MNERLQRILLVVGFVLIVGLLAFGLYWVFFRPQATGPVVTPPGTQKPGTLPGTGKAGPPGTVTTGTTGLPTPAAFRLPFRPCRPAFLRPSARPS